MNSLNIHSYVHWIPIKEALVTSGIIWKLYGYIKTRLLLEDVLMGIIKMKLQTSLTASLSRVYSVTWIILDLVNARSVIQFAI